MINLIQSHHRPASLQRNYSLPVVSIMAVLMEKSWWWRQRRFPLLGAQNRLQISPPEEEQEVAVAPSRETRWKLISGFFLHRWDFIGQELGSEEPRGPHKPSRRGLVWVPWCVVAPWHTPSGRSSLHNSLYIPKVIHKRFHPIPGTFISAHK